MGRLQISSVLAILGGLALATGQAFAQTTPPQNTPAQTTPATATAAPGAESVKSGGHGENRHRPDMLAHLSHFLAPLDLTAAQKSQLAAIVATESPKFAELRKTRHDSMMALFKSDPADTQSVARTAQIIGDNAKQMVLEMGSMRASVAHLLTPAQQAQLTARKLNMWCAGMLMGAEGRKGFHDHMGGGHMGGGHMGGWMHHHAHAQTEDVPVTH